MIRYTPHFAMALLVGLIIAPGCADTPAPGLSGREDAPRPTNSLTPDDAAFSRERQAAIDALGGTSHAEKMWLLALQMSNGGYRFTGSGEPLGSDTPSLKRAVRGFRGVSPPDTGVYAVHWQLTAPAAYEGKAHSFLKALFDGGRYDRAFLRAVEEEWGRFIVSQFPVVWRAGAGLLRRADFHHQDLVADRPQRGYRGALARLDYKILAYDRSDLLGEIWQYHVELEQVVGDYTLKVSIRDDVGLHDDEEPWGRIVMWFIYTPPTD